MIRYCVCTLLYIALSNAKWILTVTIEERLHANKYLKDCPYLAELCENEPCKHIKPSLPTESIFDPNDKTKMKTSIVGTKQNDGEGSM